jgi:hypothetical protein
MMDDDSILAQPGSAELNAPNLMDQLHPKSPLLQHSRVPVRKRIRRTPRHQWPARQTDPPGDSLQSGQLLAVLEAMKMHYEIRAEIDGTVAEVAADDILIELDVVDVAGPQP